MKKTLFSAFFATLALIGCSLDNTSSHQSGSTGSAQIRLPKVPAQALAKTTTMPRPEMFFEISVSGPGMETQTQKWSAWDFGGKTVTIEDIPSGADRNFTGRVLLAGKVTHEGSFTTEVLGGQTAYVPLVLRDIGTGRAEICLEVEGWPGSPDCIIWDSVPEPQDTLLDCFGIEIHSAKYDLSGNLNLYVNHDSVSGFLSVMNALGYEVKGTLVGTSAYLTLERQVEYIISAAGIKCPKPPDHYPIWDSLPPIEEPSEKIYLRLDLESWAPYSDMDSMRTAKGAVMDSTFSQYLGSVDGWQSGCYSTPADSVGYSEPDPLPMIDNYSIDSTGFQPAVK